MKKLILVIAIFSCVVTTQAQLEVGSTKESSIEKPYDSSYLSSSNSSITDEDIKGWVGQKVLVTEISLLYFTDQDGKSISNSDDYEFKVYKIVEVDLEGYKKKISLKNIGTDEVIIWEKSYGAKNVIFLGGFDKILLSQVGKSFGSFHPIEIEDLDGVKCNVDINNPLTIDKIYLSDESGSVELIFGVNVSQDNSTYKYKLAWDYFLLRSLPEEITIKGKGYLSTANLYSLEIIESTKKKYPQFIEDITKRVVKVGMTKELVSYSWGMHIRSMEYQGYDIWIFSNYQVWFKDGLVEKLINASE